MSTLAQRLLHTSRPHRAPAASARNGNILGGLAGGNSSSSTASSPLDVARQGSNLLAFYEEEAPAVASPERIDVYRKISPHHLTAPHLFPTTSSPNPKPPLLGPPRSIARSIDPFYQNRYSTTPLEHVFNPHFVHNFTNQMGRIKSRAETGLTWRSQRAVGKMVRRARAMGLVSKWCNVPADKGYGATRY